MSDAKMVGLPILVASPVDLGRMIREAEAIDSTLSQESLRGADVTVVPKMSELLSQTVEMNKLNLIQSNDRKLLVQFLTSTRDKAPRLHMSFSADPSPQFSAKLTSWLRENIHPLVLITIGLQPNIGAGSVVRTTNKYFDFSLGKALTKNRTMLMTQLRQAVTDQQANEAKMPTETAEVPA
ncbi:hypothetical protein H7097_02070 [Aeromicrobium sp.]|nr:hypothetical protein [Candidatus Saccharibacteria bacterium]